MSNPTELLDRDRQLFEAEAAKRAVDLERSTMFPDRYKYQYAAFLWDFWQSARRAQPEGEAPQAAAPDAMTAFRKCHQEVGDQDCEYTWLQAWAAAQLSKPASAPGTPEALAEDRKGIELWRATLRACGELPEGYEVRIELENGCGMAVWYDAEGERHVIDGDGYLSDDVDEAVDAAIQRAAQLDGGQGEGEKA